MEKVFPGAQLLGDVFHNMQYFSASIKGFSKNACYVMKEVSKALWKTVAGTPTDETSKRFVNSAEDFSSGADLVFRHAQANKVKVDANKFFAAKTRTEAMIANGYLDNPHMGCYVDTVGAGAISTMGTNAEETFHRCIRVFVKGGQSCPVTLHALIVGFTVKYDMNKLSRLEVSTLLLHSKLYILYSTLT